MERHDRPMAIDTDETLYFKPDAAASCLPVDETLTQPCDAQPDEYDSSHDRFESVTKLRVKRLSAGWFAQFRAGSHAG